MKQAYRTFRFSSDTRALIDFLDRLVGEYQLAGYVLSVRQLYYQLVARDVVPNTEKSYKRVASIINDARLAGLLDWDMIEDRGRDIVVRNRWSSGAAIVQAVADQYHMDMWKGQERRVFVIVEKAALAGVLDRPTRDYDVPLLAAKGYPSVSIVRELVEQQLMPAIDDGQDCLVLHLGDHDPSGIDMTRDLQERIELFLEQEDAGSSVEVRRIALNMHQVAKYEPPPNPAKVTDSRFAAYQREHGDESWELDALEPAVLAALVTKHIQAEIDEAAWRERKDLIDEVKSKLQRISDRFEVIE